MAEEERRSEVGISQEVRECIKATSDCYSVSAETFKYCVEGEMDLRDPQLMRLLIDCCEICQTAQNSMLRGSDEQLIRCSEVCDETADCCRRLAI